MHLDRDAQIKDQARWTARCALRPSQRGPPGDLMTLAPADYAKRISGVSVKLDALARPAVERSPQPDFHTTDVLGRRADQHRSPRCRTASRPAPSGSRQRSAVPRVSPVHRAGREPTAAVLGRAAQMAERIDFKNVLSVTASAGWQSCGGAGRHPVRESRAVYVSANARTHIFSESPGVGQAAVRRLGRTVRSRPRKARPARFATRSPRDDHGGGAREREIMDIPSVHGGRVHAGTSCRAVWSTR